MCAAYADFLHYYCRATVSSDCYLFLAQTYQKYRESFALRVEVNLLKDGVRWIGCILQIEQHVLPTLICELWLIVLLAQLTFGLLI